MYAPFFSNNFNSDSYTPHYMYLIEETLSEKEHQPWKRRHNGILGTMQNELFNYSNKDLLLRKTLLENVL